MFMTSGSFEAYYAVFDGILWRAKVINCERLETMNTVYMRVSEVYDEKSKSVRF